jgi:hypothetical protein
MKSSAGCLVLTDREVAMALYWNFAEDYSFIGGARLFNFKLVLKGDFTEQIRANVFLGY